MKTRKALKRELAAAQEALRGCQRDRTAVHEARSAAESQAEQERGAALNAERERGEAVARADAALAEALECRAKMDEAIGLRDGWSERAQEMTVARDEAVFALREMTERAVAAERKHEQLFLGTQQWESQSVEAREQADLAVTERNAAWVDRDSLAERLHQAEDALIVVARERDATEDALAAEQSKAAEVRQALADCRESRGIMQAQRDSILAAAADQGIMIPVPVPGPTPKLERDAEEAVVESRVAVSSGEDVPLIACENWGEHMGHAWWGASHSGPEMRWCDGRNADGSGPYDPAHENVILKHFGVREDQSVTIGGRDVPTVVGGRAVPLALGHDALVADNRVLTDRANEATSRADMAERSYSELHSRLVVMMEERDNLLVENEALNKEREDALEALRQVKSERDVLRPLALLEDAQAAAVQIDFATQRMDRAEAEFENLRRERDAAIERAALAESDLRGANVAWTESVKAVRREVGEMQRERDEWSERAETHRQERDQAVAERDEARGWIGAVNAVLGDHRGSAAFVDDAVAEVVRKLHAAIQRENDAVGSMKLDGAMENALGKLVGVLGVEAYESPADVIDSAMEAIKDARREAGRLKLVLDIIDERKASQPVEVERRGHEDV